MNKKQWFIEAIKNGSFLRKEWCISIFSITKSASRRESDDAEITGSLSSDLHYTSTSEWSETKYDYTIGYIWNGDVLEDVVFYIRDEAIAIDDYKFNKKNPEPPFRINEPVNLSKGDLVNLDANVKTTYGRALANQLLLCYPFRDIIPYINKRFDLGTVEGIIENKLTSNPPEGEPRDPSIIYVEDYKKLTKSAGMIAGLTQISVPGASRTSMTPPPGIDKLKKELLEKYKDDIDNPVTVLKIEEELIKAIKEHIKGDTSEGFLISGKSVNVILKKSFGSVGHMNSFKDSGEEGKFVTRSLSEGMSLDDLTQLINNSREGSYDRGAETALGGYEVKRMLEVTQNMKVDEKDCGDKNGYDILVTEENIPFIADANMIDKGKVVPLNRELLSSKIGKVVKIRTPYYCRAPDGNVCNVCIGQKYANRPTSLPTALSGVGSTFMGIFMASMHAKVANYSRYDLEKHII